MSRIAQLTFALITCVLLCSCSKEDPNPELRDPIYADLQKRAAEHQKSFDESAANLKGLREKLEKAEANSLEKRDIQRDIAKNTRMNKDSEQWARYYKIRSERRRIVDKLAYKEAFAAKREWPNPHEYSDYLTNRRLVEVNRNWNVRVPKLVSRLPGHAPAPKKAEGGEKKPSH